MPTNDDMHVIAPEPRVVCVGDDRIEITPLRVGDLPAVTRMLRGIDLSGGIDARTLMKLADEHGDALMELLAIALRRSHTWVRDQTLDVFMDLLLTCIEVNADFFVQRLLPQLNRMASLAQGSRPQAGLM